MEITLQRQIKIKHKQQKLYTSNAYVNTLKFNQVLKWKIMTNLLIILLDKSLIRL